MYPVAKNFKGTTPDLQVVVFEEVIVDFGRGAVS